MIHVKNQYFVGCQITFGLNASKWNKSFRLQYFLYLTWLFIRGGHKDIMNHLYKGRTKWDTLNNMCLLGKSRIRQKYYLSAFDNPTKQVMVIYNSSIKVLILMTIYEELDHIWFRIDTKFISFLYECLRQKFYSFEIFSLIALSIRAWLTISHIQQELTLPFIQKHTSFQMILLWSAFCIGRNKIYYIMHVLNDNNYGMKNFQFHFNDIFFSFWNVIFWETQGY